ncbi:MAG TPA: SHOCT domain-containing protein [Gaiellaceae bacterium]|jgi:putative membrane protein|nr:SHOCT domain-containing protein [Gaiellaceae bacterium]
MLNTWTLTFASRGEDWDHAWWPLWLVLWLVVLGTIAWLVVRRRRDSGGDARKILAERYARGELSTDEYEERLQGLR